MAILKEIKVLVRRSIAERGTLRTAIRCALAGPVYIWHRIQEMRYRPSAEVSDFDRMFGVDTDGATNNTTHLRDLEISSPNWVHSYDYIPVKPDRFRSALSALAIPHERFLFIDFGCGKGRAVLLAAELPFQRVVGVDFSQELVAIARNNWATYRNPAQRCREAEFVCADFLDYQIPLSPTVLFFFNPCAEHILRRVAESIRHALAQNPRPTFILYLNPQFPHVWPNLGFSLVDESQEFGYKIYSMRDQAA